MHPRAPDVLTALCAAAQTMIRADRPRGYEDDLRACSRLMVEIADLRKMPDEDGEHLIDDATLWLAQALRNAEREGPHGDCQKWIRLAECFLPWVQADLAIAIERRHGIPPAQFKRPR